MAQDPRIEHVIVLVLENRSFDHMLGWLYPKKSRADFNGVQGKPRLSNPRDPADPAGGVVPVARGTPWVTSPDPAHEFADATFQLYGLEASDYQAAPTGAGFLESYRRAQEKAAEERWQAERMHADAPGPPTFEIPPEVNGEDIMTCFERGSLPALHALAKEFAVCDAWFSSLPGPTWPNRFFVHCASSDGRVGMDLDDLLHPYAMDTIFNRLEDAEKTWAVYYHDIPQSFMLRKVRPYRDNFKLIYDFAKDVKAGTLPGYSFIEPRYFDFLSQKANDQHPPHDVRYGDVLIGRIYETLRSNDALWRKSMLVITYDEHGGYYDHVPPGAVAAPGAPAGEDEPEFAFGRYGVRVPAVVVSPYVEQGAVCHEVFDHTSIPATLKEIFDLPDALTDRDRAARTLTASVLTRATPREVALKRVPRTHATRPIWKEVEAAESREVTLRDVNRAVRDDTLSPEPLSGLQQALLDTTREVTGVPAEKITTEGEGALHVQHVMQWVKLGHGMSADGAADG